MVVMDQYTRRIIGFGVHAGNVDGPALCRIFSEATAGHKKLSLSQYILQGHQYHPVHLLTKLRCSPST